MITDYMNLYNETFRLKPGKSFRYDIFEVGRNEDKTFTVKNIDTNEFEIVLSPDAVIDFIYLEGEGESL